MVIEAASASRVLRMRDYSCEPLHPIRELYLRETKNYPLITEHEEEKTLGYRIREGQLAHTTLQQRANLGILPEGIATKVKEATSQAMISLRKKKYIYPNTLGSLLDEDLFQRMLAGFEAYQQLVTGNLRLVVKIVKNEYVSASSKYGDLDLVQIGNLGLLNAAARYDPDKSGGEKADDGTIVFSTFARSCIRSQINLMLRTKRLTEVPENTDESNKVKFARLDKKLAMGNGEETEITVADVLKDPQSSELFEAVDESIEQEKICAIVSAALSQITEDENRRLIRQYFGFHGQVPKTLQEIGNDEKKTKQAMSLRKINTLRELAKILLGLGYDPGEHLQKTSNGNSNDLKPKQQTA